MALPLYFHSFLAGFLGNGTDIDGNLIDDFCNHHMAYYAHWDTATLVRDFIPLTTSDDASSGGGLNMHQRVNMEFIRQHIERLTIERSFNHLAPFRMTILYHTQRPAKRSRRPLKNAMILQFGISAWRPPGFREVKSGEFTSMPLTKELEIAFKLRF